MLKEVFKYIWFEVFTYILTEIVSSVWRLSIGTPDEETINQAGGGTAAVKESVSVHMVMEPSIFILQLYRVQHIPITRHSFLSAARSGTHKSCTVGA